MAVDTRNKRASAICVGLPWRPLPNPDGTIDEFDQQQVAYSYAGIDALAPVAPLGGSRYGMLENLTRGGI